jgi:hypothetical protein
MTRNDLGLAGSQTNRPGSKINNISHILLCINVFDLPSTQTLTEESAFYAPRFMQLLL